MTSAGHRGELFAVEAEEFLADLERLTAGREIEDVERLVRGARSLRGAAMFAGFGTYARAAAGLEALARQLRAGGLTWDSATRDAVLGAIEGLRALLPQGTRWDAASDREALALAERLERIGGSGPRPPAETAAPLTAGVRSFVARESALIAGSLERAARALSPLPPTEALAAVLERMRSLRGLGSSAELSPLPELLDAMEVATRTLLGDTPPPPDVADLFDEAARVLGVMARAIGEQGRVAPPAELDRVALHLLTAYTQERDVVPIASLAADGEPLIVHQGTPPPPNDAAPVPIELVGVGDHLLLIADTLARPIPPVVRDLRLFVLHRTLASMPPRSATAYFLQPVTATINGAIAQGVAGRSLDAFVTLLRSWGRFLIDRGGGQSLPALRDERDRMVTALQRDGVVALPTPVTTPPAPAEEMIMHDPAPAPADDLPTDIVSIESLAPSFEVGQLEPATDFLPGVEVASDEPEDQTPFVWDLRPVEEIRPDPVVLREVMTTPDPIALRPTTVEVPEPEPIAVPAPEPVPDVAVTAELPIVSMHTLLVADAEEVEPLPIVPMHTLLVTEDEDLVGTPIVPIEALMAEADRATIRRGVPREAPGEPSRLEAAFRGLRRLQDDSPTAPEPEDVPSIDLLCYRGEAALARARELHADLSRRLTADPSAIRGAQPALDELLDLVSLARHAA